MICEACHGTGRRGATLWPCEACTGGIASCCDAAGSSGSVAPLRVHQAWEHLPYAYCWCGPEKVSDGVWLHRERPYEA